MEAALTLMIRDEQAVPAAGAGGRGGGLVALQQLVELTDRRIQASAFFFAWGACVMLHGTAINTADNQDHTLVGFGMFTVGAVLAFLTLSGSDRLGRAAARIEEGLRGLF